jgi:ABC-type branched-subunit amino acid transport system permease subunit
MRSFGFFQTHRSWEDWLGMLLGVLIALSPWFPGQFLLPYGDFDVIAVNAIAVGILVLGLAELEYVALQRWEETAEAFLGVWLIASPLVFGYSTEGSLRFWHSSLGGLVVLLALLQLWQDWELSDNDMSRQR